jgi:hypothetical protein
VPRRVSRKDDVELAQIHATSTVHSPSVGADIITHGHATAQLQISKYVPLSFHCPAIVTVYLFSRADVKADLRDRGQEYP